jgi:hypothetical protein
MMTLSLHQDGRAGLDGHYYPERSILFTYDEGTTWMSVLEGFRDAMNGLGYQVPELGEAEDWDEVVEDDDFSGLDGEELGDVEKGENDNGD